MSLFSCAACKAKDDEIAFLRAFFPKLQDVPVTRAMDANKAQSVHPETADAAQPGVFHRSTDEFVDMQYDENETGETDEELIERVMTDAQKAEGL